jgi:hypothetical protein
MRRRRTADQLCPTPAIQRSSSPHIPFCNAVDFIEMPIEDKDPAKLPVSNCVLSVADAAAHLKESNPVFDACRYWPSFSPIRSYF